VLVHKSLLIIDLLYNLPQASVKAWIHRHWCCLANSETPEIDLFEACGTVTAEKARGWFRRSGYM